MLGKNLRSLWVETDPDKALARARRAAEKGRLDSAASALKDALEAGGEEPRLRMELARILVSAGQVREAAEGLRAFLKARPEDHAHVREFVEWARGQHGEVTQLQETLADHHVHRKELGPAFDALERVDKKDLQTLLDARLAGFRKYLEKSPQAVPKSALPLLYFAALACEAMGDFPKAVETYRRIVTASPAEIAAVEPRLKSILARNYRSGQLRAAAAEILMGAGQEARALAEYDQMVEADPRSAGAAAAAVERMAAASQEPGAALLTLARIRRREGKVDEVLRTAGTLIAAGRHADELLEILESLVAEGKQDPRIHLVIGEVALRAGKVQRAVSALASVAAHPSPEIRARACESLQRIVEENHAEKRAAELLADYLLKEARYDECVSVLSRLVAADAGATPLASARLQTILLSQPGHLGAEALLESLAPALGDRRLASAFLRRRLRAGPAEAKEALGAIHRLLANEPRDPDLLIASAEAHAAFGDHAGAWAVARNLVDSTMGPDPTLLHLMVLIGGSSPDLCREVSNVFRAMAPALAGSPEGTFALGEMAARSGDLDAALESFRAAAAFSAGAAAEVVEAVRGIGGASLSGETAVALAEVLLDAGDPAGAASVLAKAPALPAAASRALGRLEEALRTRPDDTPLRVALAGALAAGGRASRARQIIEDGIRLGGDGAPPSLHLASGDVWIREGNLTEAVRAYARAMARDKSLASEASARIEKVLEIDVGHPSAHLALGRARLLDARPRDGVNALLTAWSIRPSLGASILKDLAYAARAFPLEPQVDLARAQILFGQGEVDAASDALGSALRTSPSIAEEVLARLQPIARSHPSCARARLHMARAFQIRGRCGEAAASYQAAAEIDASVSDQVSTGLSELVRDFRDRMEPHLSRAKLYESQEAWGPAAEAYLEATMRGSVRSDTMEPLRALAARGGPQRGRVLLALARASRALEMPAEAARACEEAAAEAPDLLEAIRAEIVDLTAAHPSSPEALLARARIFLTSMDAAAALADVERLLEIDPSRHGEAAALAAEIAGAGGDGERCAWVRARALAASGAFDAAGEILETWAPRAEGAMRSRMHLLLSRVERRRGRSEEARRRLAEAEREAPDRDAFLAALHAEALASARDACARAGSPSDLWRALKASLDVGDADRAESIAADLGLSRRPGGAQEDAAAAETAARIACLRGRYGRAADLLAGSPPSALRAYALKRAGRLVEAAACLAEMEPAGGAPSVAARGVYRRLAAAEFLNEPFCLEAETVLRFPDAKEATTP